MFGRGTVLKALCCIYYFELGDRIFGRKRTRVKDGGACTILYSRKYIKVSQVVERN